MFEMGMCVQVCDTTSGEVSDLTEFLVVSYLLAEGEQNTQSNDHMELHGVSASSAQ